MQVELRGFPCVMKTESGCRSARRHRNIWVRVNKFSGISAKVVHIIICFASVASGSVPDDNNLTFVA